MKITVLLADDHAVVRDGLRLLLEMQPDIEVVGAVGNGREAVQQVQKLCPDVAILDIMMPELNGLEAAQHISQDCPQCRVIILSMHRTPEHISRALRAGVQGYVLKDAAGEEVVAAVRMVQAGRRYLSQEITDMVISHYLSTLPEEGAADPLQQLTQREREVLQLLVEGKSSIEIANELTISPRTVDTYRSRIMRKLEIPHLAGVVKFAIRHGLIDVN